MLPSFKAYLQECMEGVPAHEWDPSSIQLHDEQARTRINFLLSDLTYDSVGYPATVFHSISLVLEEMCGIVLPSVSVYGGTFSEPDGEIIIPLVCPQTEGCIYFYFAFVEDEAGLTFEVFAELLTATELESILDETE